jgi:hypothetical protein
LEVNNAATTAARRSKAESVTYSWTPKVLLPEKDSGALLPRRWVVERTFS